jgi:uncharacterized protein (DUF983 family)
MSEFVTKQEFNELKKEIKKIEKFVTETLSPHSKNGRLVECDKCGHPFIYKGNLKMATCSSCGNKVKLK